MSRTRVKILIMVVTALALAIANDFAAAGEASMQLTSSAFKEGQMIPADYTCDGRDASPPLAWSGAPDGALQGINDFQRHGYGGPCPPGGTHRYFFKLYALDKILALGPGAAKSQLEPAMKGHILAEARLMGAYRRRS